MTGYVEWCQHPRAHHMHGTAAAYLKCGCRCDACKAAQSVTAKRRRHRRVSGTSRYVDATRARSHVQRLLMVLTASQIASRSGLYPRTIHGLAEEPPVGQRRIARDIEAKVLAVRPTVLVEGDHALIAAVGTQRRIQALMACGWDQKAIAAAAGLDQSSIGGILRRAHVVARSRERVVHAYDQLWDQTPDISTVVRRGVVTRTRRRAQALGYMPPLAWDDDDIDDPAAVPQMPRGARDLCDEVRYLAATGESIDSAATRLGVTCASIYQAFRRADAVAEWARLTGHPAGIAA